MHLLAMVVIFAFAAVTAVSAASLGAESRKAPVPVRVKRRRPDVG